MSNNNKIGASASGTGLPINGDQEVSAVPVGIPDAVRDALLDYNDVLRSASAIAKREGVDTRWDTFARRLSAILKKLHATWLAVYSDDPVVGHATLEDGSHVPVRKSVADALWAQAEAEDARRKAAMPDEQSAIRQLWDAQERLKQLGWRDPVYAPKDGSPLDIIELGSTGIHRGHYEGEWPKGSWWICDGDIWPSRPALARAAQGIEAGTGETEGLDPKDESPVAKPCAHLGAPA